MSVYGIYRSLYETPLGRRRVTFSDDTLLGWFQRHWGRVQALPPATELNFFGAAESLTESVFDGAVYGFSQVWAAMKDGGEAPSSNRALIDWLGGLSYPGGEIHAASHALQIVTDDDELELALLMFDDHFVRRHPERTAFVLFPDWALPTRVRSRTDRFVWRGPVNDLAPGGAGPGDVYLIFIVNRDGLWLSGLSGAYRIRGLRLPGLVRHLNDEIPALPSRADRHGRPWPDELALLRWMALQRGRRAKLRGVIEAADRERPGRIVRLMSSDRSRPEFLRGTPAQCRADWREVERRAKRAPKIPTVWKHVRRPSRIQTAPHFAQITFTETACAPDIDRPSYDLNAHWYLFDDLWAASHPQLARSLLWWAGDALPLFPACGYATDLNSA